MDRTGWIVVISCGLGIVLWSTLVMPKLNPPAPDRPYGQEEVVDGAPSDPTTAPEGMPSPVDLPEGAPRELTESAEVHTEEVAFHFTNTGGGLAWAELLDHAKEYGSTERITLNNPELRNRWDRPHAIGSLGKKVGRTVEEGGGGREYQVDFESTTYEMEKVDAATVRFTGAHSDGLSVRKEFRLPVLSSDEETAKTDGHLVEYSLTIQNETQVPLNLSDYSIYAGAAAATSASRLAQGETAVVFKGRGGMDLKRSTWFNGFLLRPERSAFGESIRELNWIGVQSQFFTTLMRAVEPGTAEVWSRPFPVNIGGDDEISVRRRFQGIEASIGLPPVPLGPGESRTFRYEIYTGPKEYRQLKQLPAGQGAAMAYDKIPVIGAMFGWVIRPIAQILVWLLDFFGSWIGNFGVAVLLLTIVVRAVMWPLHAKAHLTSKRMSLLTPKLTELKEKYADDPQKMSQEQMRLWGDYGINPMGGCLPAFFQMPIFIGYFRMLASATELRHEPFVAWIKDLSMPDTILTFPQWMGGFDLNLLPILMAATSFLQFAMMPKTGDRNQRIMFMMFPLMFLFFCYTYASALALYWTWSNVISIGQTWVFNKRKIPPLEKVKKAGKGGKSWMERLQDQAEAARKAQESQRKGGGGSGAKGGGGTA
ncbi:MAG: YidC/Oxa1 family insertase periplasmic-domain containing protein, partial [Verrucomicrobiota bacterium]